MQECEEEGLCASSSWQGMWVHAQIQLLLALLN